MKQGQLEVSLARTEGGSRMNLLEVGASLDHKLRRSKCQRAGAEKRGVSEYGTCCSSATGRGFERARWAGRGSCGSPTERSWDPPGPVELFLRPGIAPLFDQARGIIIDHET